MVSQATERTDFDDWKHDLECVGKSRRCLCKGYFQEEISKDNHFGEDLVLTGDSGEFIVNKVGQLLGKATAEKQQQRITADRMNIYFSSDQGKIEKIDAHTNVKIMSPTERFNADLATLYLEDDKKELLNSSYSLYESHSFGYSDKITITDSSSVIWMNNATYSTCEPSIAPVWKLKSKKLKLDRDEGWGHAWHTRLYVKSVPVFYWPYMNFPIDDRRKTGFLSPSMEVNSHSGKTFVLPFYWNIAPNYDATITPLLSIKTGVRVFNQFRYLNSNNQGVIDLDLVPYDRAYQEFRRGKIANPGGRAITSPQMMKLSSNSKRYALNVQHVGDAYNFKYRMYYIKVGDANFINNFDQRILKQSLPRKTFQFAEVLNPQLLPQQFTGQYASKAGNTTVTLTQYQALYAFNASTPGSMYRILPSLGHFMTPQLFHGFELNSDLSFTHFQQFIVTGQPLLTTGQREHIQANIVRKVNHNPGWFLTPKVKIDCLMESLHRKPSEVSKRKSPQRIIPTYTLTSGLILERDVSLNKNDYLQTLEPTAMYLYTPYKDQQDFPKFESGEALFDYNQVFRDNRFSGYDEISSAHQISLGLTSRLMTDLGEDKIILSVGGVYYLNKLRQSPLERAVSSRHHTPIASKLFYNINNKFVANANWVYDTVLKKNNYVSIGTYFRPNNYNVFNVNYSLDRRVNGGFINQLSGSVSVYPQDHLHLQALAHYDIKAKNLNRLAGSVEFFRCCYSVKLTWNHARTLRSSVNTGAYARKYENAIGLQFSLTGLTDISAGKVSELSVANAAMPYRGKL